jgi:hypothetical protein
MRGAMLYAAGLLTGLAVQVGIAQNANAELTPESLHYKAIQSWK